MRESIVRRSGKELKHGKTDWPRIAAMSEEELLAAAESDPDAQPTGPDFWENARVVVPLRKVLVTYQDLVKNGGRIAERIVANELEARGFSCE
jgi:hypothetical protein